MKSLTSGGWYRRRKRITRDYRTYLICQATSQITSAFLFLPSNKVWYRAVFQPKIRSQTLRFHALQNMKIDSYCVNTFLTTFVTLRSYVGLLKGCLTHGSWLEEFSRARHWNNVPTAISNKVTLFWFHTKFTQNCTVCSLRQGYLIPKVILWFSFCPALN